MKKIITLFLLFLFSAFPAFAHGGIEKNAENTIVYINQIPISPLVGEKVNFTFQFRDPTVPKGSDLSKQNLVNTPVVISVIDTFYGDESKDKTIFSKKFVTDENGNISFSFSFPRENYYDIDFSYKDHNGISQETGYLVQPRNVNRSASAFYLVPIILGSVLLGFLISVKLRE